MLPLYKVTPAISGLGVGWKTEKMVTGEEPLVIVIAVVTAVNGTLFPSFLRNWLRSILVGIIAVHYRKVWRKKAGQNRRKSKDGCRFSVKHTRYEMRLNVSLDMRFARLLFQDGAGNCKKKYLTPVSHLFFSKCNNATILHCIHSVYVICHHMKDQVLLTVVARLHFCTSFPLPSEFL